MPSVEERLEKIEAPLARLVERQTVRDWYATDEFARLVDKAEFTVREWCRLGRIRAEKRLSGRGSFPAWVISHTELLRYQREGLLLVNNAPATGYSGPPRAFPHRQAR
jgi:hypothetical protein